MSQIETQSFKLKGQGHTIRLIQPMNLLLSWINAKSKPLFATINTGKIENSLKHNES